MTTKKSDLSRLTHCKCGCGTKLCGAGKSGYAPGHYLRSAESKRKSSESNKGKGSGIDPEKVKAKRKRYYERHRDEILAKQREWYRNNSEYARNYTKEWRALNPERTKTGHRKWMEENRERGRKQRAEWRSKNPEKYLDSWLKSSYGISLEEYRCMESSQGGVCCICRHKNEHGKRLAVDHDHATGVIRGLLCDKCNRALGLMKDRPDNLRAAADYLERTLESAEKVARDG